VLGLASRRPEGGLVGGEFPERQHLAPLLGHGPFLGRLRDAAEVLDVAAAARRDSHGPPGDFEVDPLALVNVPEERDHGNCVVVLVGQLGTGQDTRAILAGNPPRCPQGTWSSPRLVRRTR